MLSQGCRYAPTAGLKLRTPSALTQTEALLEISDRRTRQLLIRLAIVHHPSCGMPALWVVVGPVDDPTFRVPDVLAAKANAVTYLKPVDARGDVDVVCKQKCLS